jgi:hypothetical protein
MPIDIRVLHTGMRILYHCHGTVNGKEFIDANNRLLALSERLNQARYGIVDLTAAVDVRISESELLTITAQNKKIAYIVPPGAVVAVITQDNFAIRLSRLWESFVEYTGWETMTFRIRWKAEGWIVEKIKINFGIDLIFENGITVY